MPFLFKIAAILIGIFIWKTVMASFAKAKEAMRDDEDGGAGSRAHLDLETQWREAAEALTGTFDPGEGPNMKNASITGSISGHSFTIKRFGRNYVRYFVGFRNATRIQVCVVRDMQTIAERILDGHPIFPSKMFFSSQEPDFYCSAESEAAFDRFLEMPSNRSAVLNLVRLFPAGMFNNEGVSVRLRASVPDVEVISRMATIANALENPSQTPMPDLMTAEKKGLLAVPAEFSFADDAEDENEEDVPKRFPPIQVVASTTKAKKTSKIQVRKPDASAAARTTVIRISPEAKRTGISDTVKSDIVRSTPEKTVLFSPEKQVPAVQPLKQETPVSAQSPSEAGHFRSGGSASLTVESVCAALFSKSFPSAEERAAFDAMKGRRVHWTGELQMVLPFSMDFTFGSRKGVKATLLVHEMKQGQSGIPVRIKAVAAFPPEFQAALESAKGKTVSFEGDILKFESFAREIYLQDASLES